MNHSFFLVQASCCCVRWIFRSFNCEMHNVIMFYVVNCDRSFYYIIGLNSILVESSFVCMVSRVTL